MTIKSPIQDYLERLHAKYANLGDGEVASYIPELSHANPEWFGICIATTDGRIYEVGDTRQTFTIQSISKPFTYGLALEDCGTAAVLQTVGVEPTGDAFNSISLAPDTGRPLNPMINAGAIATASLVAGRSEEDKMSRITGMYSMCAGRPLSLDEAVYESERVTGHRNRAIGHMLRNFNILRDDPEISLDRYFRQCSVSVHCRDLSVMAATLANNGVNPLTGERVMRPESVECVLSVMTSCGMYDYSGEWLYWIGMPGKSGVAGGLLVVLPGQFGVGVFSPRLDARGNSVRGIEVCKELSRDLELHVLRVARSSRSAIRARYNLSQVRSKRQRPETQHDSLRTNGHLVHIYELQGDLMLPAVETVVRAVVDQDPDVAMLDLRRVTGIADPAMRILFDLLVRMHEQGKKLVLVVTADTGHARLIRYLEEQGAERGDGLNRILKFQDRDAALEWCENHLLGRADPPVHAWGKVSLAEHEFCNGIGADALEHLENLMYRRTYQPGEYILRRGDPGDEIYLLMGGEVSVVVPRPDGTLKRLSTLTAGMTFGELSVIDRSPRSADVRADHSTECCILPADAFQALGESHPQAKIVLLGNILRGAYRMVNRLNQEISASAAG